MSFYTQFLSVLLYNGKKKEEKRSIVYMRYFLVMQQFMMPLFTLVAEMARGLVSTTKEESYNL